jgi:hypothetical protein
MKNYSLSLLGVLFLAVLMISLSTLLANKTRVKAANPQPADKPAAQSPLPSGWQLGHAIAYENLTLFPVISTEMTSTEEFITLDQGLKSGKVKVQEMGSNSRPQNRIRPTHQRHIAAQQQQRSDDGDSAEVNRVLVTNNSGKTLVLIAGEIILGGKQDRIVGHDCIVSSTNTPVPVDVFCVEHGRWQSRRGQSTDGAMAFQTAGGVMAAPKVRSRAQAEKSQSKVWEGVADNVTKNGVSTSTGTLNSVFENKQVNAKLSDYERELKSKLAAKNIVGTVVAVNGKVVSADVFASPMLFQAYQEKLLKSYALEAISAGKADKQTVTARDAEAFLSQSTGADSSVEKAGVYRVAEKQTKDDASFQLEHTAKERKVIHFNKVRKQ